jgi:hypothetical protein
MIGRSFVITVVFVQLALWIYQHASAAAECPQPTIIPIPPPGQPTFPGPLPPGLASALFNHYYTVWSDRLLQPDIAIRSDPDAWTEVVEFEGLYRPGKLFLPFILERLKAGDFRLVVALECITGINSVRLYPTPMPPPGTFGLQEVAALWAAKGGQVVETECRAHCAGDAACEQKCSDERQQYWGP